MMVMGSDTSNGKFMGASGSSILAHARDWPVEPTERKRRCFTMIELLVVMTIISVLIALLLPTLQSIREMARGAKCKSNLRQIALGLQMYVNDHQGYLPWCITWWWNAADANMAGSEVYFTDVMIPYLGGSNFSPAPVFLDPGVKDEWVRTLNFHYANNFWYMSGIDIGQSPRQADSAKEPPRCWTVKCAGDNAWTAAQWPHQGTYNVAFLDGHVGVFNAKAYGEDFNAFDSAGW
jgi:prepilin-type N-terminal cleavage/methylation domain-containing protein/prepilin-type processing-associated H-X9-DG protein